VLVATLVKLSKNHFYGHCTEFKETPFSYFLWRAWLQRCAIAYSYTLQSSETKRFSHMALSSVLAVLRMLQPQAIRLYSGTRSWCLTMDHLAWGHFTHTVYFMLSSFPNWFLVSVYQDTWQCVIQPKKPACHTMVY